MLDVGLETGTQVFNRILSKERKDEKSKFLAFSDSRMKEKEVEIKLRISGNKFIRFDQAIGKM